MYDEASYDDLIQMFSGSLILYKKEPVFVTRVDEDRTLNIREPGIVKQINVSVNDKELDFKPVQLGFCNASEDCFYLSRAPLRQFSQGLTSNTLKISIPNTYNGEHNRKDYDNIRNLSSKFLTSCIKGEYPSVKECLDKLSLENNNIRSMAFSRKFAVDRDFRLFFRNKTVGLVDNESGKFIFTRSNMYLKEVLNA